MANTHQLPPNHINPKYDTDKDSQLENAQVDALVNLASTDALSDYPLLPADVNALSNFADTDVFSAYPLAHGIDVDASANAHHVKTDNVPNWVLIDSYEDIDDTTAFDYDSGVVTVYNVYKVILQLEDASGNPNAAWLRLNADASLNYDYQYLGSGAAGVTTGDNRLQLVSAMGAAPIRNKGVVYVSGGNPASGVSANPTVACVPISWQGQDNMINGQLSVAYTDIDQLRFWTEDFSVGRLKVYGFNF